MLLSRLADRGWLIVEGVDFVWKLGAFLLAAGVVYGGIRGDLKNIHEQLREHRESMKELNKRISDCRLCNRRHDDVG